MINLELECHPDGGGEEAPDIAFVSLGGRELERVVNLHEGALNISAYEIAEFSDLPMFANAVDCGESFDPISVDICMLHVYSNGDFSWSAVYEHTNLAFSTERANIVELLEK